MVTNDINYLDLFSGCGGFRLGLQQAGFVFINEAHSEIDKYANQIYNRNFKESEDLGDVNSIRLTKLSWRPDVITFGFPCQDLSIAGKKRGLKGTRSGLFFRAIEIIRYYKPKVFIFENVKGLLSHNEGKTFEVVLQTIADIGLYECQWQLLNTRWFLPQNRERIYFIGHLRGESRSEVFPIRESSQLFNSKIRNQQRETIVTTTIRPGMNGIPGNSECYIKESQKNFQVNRIYPIDGPSVTLSSQGGGQGAKTGLYAMPVLTPDRQEKRQNGRRFKEDGEPAFTLTAQDKHGVYDGYRIRRLTPVECERLQGFPDNWTLGVSDSQRYKMLGNAVSVPVVKAIMERLYK